MYTTVEEKHLQKTTLEKPIQKTVAEKRTNKKLFWSLLVLFPTILLILILGAAMGTIIGFNKQLKGFEARVDLLEESIMLKVDHNEKTLGSLQKLIAKESPRKAKPSARVKGSYKTAKKNYYAKSARPVKVSKIVMEQQYTARSGNSGNIFNPPL
jgi:hypothetical protein